MRPPLLILVLLAVLPLLGCDTRFIGENCLNPDNVVCDGDLSCREDMPGGFCTRPCRPKGDAAGCPQDSLCIQQFGELMCSPVCRRDEDCRGPDGYECRGESGSSVRACRVKLQTDGGTPTTP